MNSGPGSRVDAGICEPLAERASLATHHLPRKNCIQNRCIVVVYFAVILDSHAAFMGDVYLSKKR
jgi:hypothetical protein